MTRCVRFCMIRTTGHEKRAQASVQPSKGEEMTDDRPQAERGWDARHPDIALLAGFVDRRLSPPERTGIEAHLAGCAECREMVADTVASRHETGIAERSPFRRRRLMIGVSAGLAAAAALFLFVRFLPPTDDAGQSNLDALVALVDAQAIRPVEGRLSAFAYRPAPVVTRGGRRDSLSPDVALAAGRLEAATTADETAPGQHRLGLARLIQGDTSGAIVAFEAGLLRDPSDGRLLNDLAAAYIERGTMTSDVADFRRALELADRSLRLAPEIVEPLFNRALALEALGDSTAADAWRAVSAREPASGWATEATQRPLQR
jgi:tetratricopeptide (TPR) repeat protein